MARLNYNVIALALMLFASCAPSDKPPMQAQPPSKANASKPAGERPVLVARPLAELPDNAVVIAGATSFLSVLLDDRGRVWAWPDEAAASLLDANNGNIEPLPAVLATGVTDVAISKIGDVLLLGAEGAVTRIEYTFDGSPGEVRISARTVIDRGPYASLEIGGENGLRQDQRTVAVLDLFGDRPADAVDVRFPARVVSYGGGNTIYAVLEDGTVWMAGRLPIGMEPDTAPYQWPYVSAPRRLDTLPEGAAELACDLNSPNAVIRFTDGTLWKVELADGDMAARCRYPPRASRVLTDVKDIQSCGGPLGILFENGMLRCGIPMDQLATALELAVKGPEGARFETILSAGQTCVVADGAGARWQVGLRDSSPSASELSPSRVAP